MTPHRLKLTLAVVLALAAAACSSPDPAVPADAAEPVTQAPAPAPPGAPAPPVAPGEPAPASPPVYDETLVNFGGYRSAIFNSDAAAVRAAYEGALEATPPPESPDACHYLLPGPTGPDGYRMGFMFEGGKFVRVDVDTADIVAPGGIVIGMTAADVQAAHAGRIEEQPHKYVDGGRYLVVSPADGGEGRLVFEVDPAGVVTEWRIGLPPQVHYVEGCS